MNGLFWPRTMWSTSLMSIGHTVNAMWSECGSRAFMAANAQNGRWPLIRGPFSILFLFQFFNRGL
ncbi:MAG: hypothetical protein ACRC2X_09200, partial [Giesbergeria sp.]